jgi:hypothetical protein
MRITHDTLMKLARDLVARRVREDRGVTAVYLCGSMLDEDPMLGGTTDIDLVFVHDDPVSIEREIVPLNAELHFDIAHHWYRDYRQTRQLRIHPWLGPTLKDCLPVHDPQHFLDFTQASVRGQFERADYVLQRARVLLEQARRGWLGCGMQKTVAEPARLNQYLKAVSHVANALASLTGAPLTERRFLVVFPERAAALEKPGLHAGLMGLLGGPNLTSDMLVDWLPMWIVAYQSTPTSLAPTRIQPERKQYYERAIETLMSESQPSAALWPMLLTWSLAAGFLPAGAPGLIGWQQFTRQLGLAGDGLANRLDALDAYLDMADETLEAWGRKQGV